MLDVLEKLLVLQDRDTRRLDLEADLEKLPLEEKRSQAHLDGDLARVAAAKKLLQENAMAVKTLQLDADTRRTTIDRLRQQQFETKKNDEYTALGKEVERYLGQVDELETQELELMEAADELQQQLADAEAALGKTQALVDEELAGYAKRRTALSENLSEVNGELAGLRTAFPDDSMLGLYDRLLKSKAGSAMAQVVGDNCQGCHMKLVKGTLAKLRAQHEVAHCENCNRLLYEV